MAQSYDVNEVPSDKEIPCVARETEQAKLYLQKYCPAAAFEQYSKKLRDDKYKSKSDRLHDLHILPAQYEEAKELINLFKVNLTVDGSDEGLEDESEGYDETKQFSPNLFDVMHHFEQTGVALPRAEVAILNLSIRKLASRFRLENVRFWGKILGRPKNYYVVEATLPDDELERRLDQLDGEEHQEGSESVSTETREPGLDEAEKKALEKALVTNLPDSEQGDEDNEPGIVEKDTTFKLEFPPLPKSTWKPDPEVAPEKLGSGTNEKVYFVCSSPGLNDWVELPEVTPQQIVVARQVVHLFTGDPEAEIHTFPPFPGREKNYLRAQIARINKGIVENNRFVPLTLKDLIDPSMSNWCHHVPNILKQGRVKWRDPTKPNGEDEVNGPSFAISICLKQAYVVSSSLSNDVNIRSQAFYELHDEEAAGIDGRSGSSRPQKEIGPPLLTPLSEDFSPDCPSPWTARPSSELRPESAVALIRSNAWPGAFAYAIEKKFANVYIGWGYKHNAFNHSPSAMPPVQDQYALDSELVEAQDPTFDEEEAYRIANLPPPEGDTAVIAGVYGPVEAKAQKMFYDKATVEATFGPIKGPPSISDRLMEMYVRDTCESAILTSMHPVSTISVNVQELQDCGGLLACAINAACLALINSSLSMKFIFAAVCCMIDKDSGKVIVDPSTLQLTNAKASFTCAFDSTNKELICCQTSGRFSEEELLEAVNKCKESTHPIFEFFRDAVKKYATAI
ncbi:hypothetical protein QAD02_005097 [Eretmocerus hayati]|uniref:Uncharacterized protein n=1 Tax=Eretmocerus hayati TaxID=131215 RepID=A0ACC2NRJ7_9HYME|nr:hypothetical protein QAD02_005097 [Eretmocerus hayati]